MSAHDRAVANVRRYTRRRVVRLLEGAGFRLLFASYWNTFLFPLMVLTRKLLPCRRRRRQRRQAAAARGRGLVPRRDRARTRAARPRVRLPFGGSVIAVAAKRARDSYREEYMPDSMPLLPADPVMTLPGAASPGASPPALSIVIPVYNGADSIGELVAALEELRIAGGHEIVLVNDGSPDNSLEVCRALVDAGARADHAGRPVAQLRRAQRRDGRAAPCHRRACHHDGRRSAEPARGGRAAARLTRSRADARSSTPITTKSSTRRGAISAAGSPTGSPVSCSTSRRVSICRASAA